MRPDRATVEPVEGSPYGVEISTDTTRSTAGLHGELDLVTASRLRAVLGRLLRDGHREVVVDLARLEFLSVAGPNVPVRADREFSEAGGRVTLVNLTSTARRILRITGPATVLSLE